MFPVLRVGGLSLSTYGTLVALGYLTGICWLWRNLRHIRGTFVTFWALIFALFIGAVAGGKIGYWIVEWRYYAQHLDALLRFWNRGWVFWGGFLGSCVMGLVYQTVHNRHLRPRRYLPVADYFGAALPMGHWMGRIGCLAQGCCYGRPTALPWGVRFTRPSAVEPALRGVALHPVQLYESAGVLAICLINVWYVLPGIRAGKFRYGTAFFGYFAMYAVLRFVTEFFRGDPRGELLWPVLSPSQWISLAVLLAMGAIFYRNGILEKEGATRSIYL